MCVLYESFASTVRRKTFECVAMGSAVLVILRYILLLFSAGSGVNRVQVVLSGFSVSLFCSDIFLCRYGCVYFLVVPRLLYTQAPKLTHTHIAYPAV